MTIYMAREVFEGGREPRLKRKRSTREMKVGTIMPSLRDLTAASFCWALQDRIRDFIQGMDLVDLPIRFAEALAICVWLVAEGWL